MTQENKDSTKLSKQLDTAKASIADLMLQKNRLQNRLMSTEETVRQQADRLKKTKAAFGEETSPIRKYFIP